VYHRIVFNIGRFLNMMTPNFQVFAERGSTMLIECRSLNPACVEHVALAPAPPTPAITVAMRFIT
jgi:hypothetical protein